MKKYLILFLYLIVQKYGYSQKDTTLTVSKKVLANIYTDLSVCETSLSSCLDREVFYLQKDIVNLNTINMYNEIIYNDSIVNVELLKENTFLRENKNNLEKSNKNLVKSNFLFKLLSISELGIIVVALLIL